MPQDHQGKKLRRGLHRALEGILERLRQGMEELAGQLAQRPQPVPIPVPVQRRPRRG